jgi:hypothetical protein
MTLSLILAIVAATASDSRVKVAAATTTTGITFDFSFPKMGEDACHSARDSCTLLPEGLLSGSDTETIPEPRPNEVMIFKDLFQRGFT